MIDPMANLGNEGFDPTTSNNAVGDLSARSNNRINIHAIHLNNKKIDKVRSFMGIISGCVAGVWGLTGLQGLGTCVLLHLCRLSVWSAFVIRSNATMTHQDFSFFSIVKIIAAECCIILPSVLSYTAYFGECVINSL